MKSAKKTIVISAINIFEGGPLVILKECLSYLSAVLADEYNIVALVSKRALFDSPGICYHEFPQSRKSWLNRVYYEYIYFGYFSKRMAPYLWFSFHDITPNVKAERRAVYCHNSSLFYKLSVIDLIRDFKFAIFVKFYKYIYIINIQKNNYVVVQHDWMRRKFEKIYELKNIIVANTDIEFPKSYLMNEKNENRSEEKDVSFIYPAFPRCFKNYEVICEAAKILNNCGIGGFKIYLTIAGNENIYSKSLYFKYNSINSIKFIGLLPRDKVYEYYRKVNCLIFSSKLESWGLPITEFKVFNKPILLADLEYAHETLGEYNKAKFFAPDNPSQLADIMKDIINNQIKYDLQSKERIAPPFASNWQELFEILLSDKVKA